jgi:type I restriction enzyme M protein
MARAKSSAPSAQSSATIGFEADFGPGHADTFSHVQLPDLRADDVLANPPFNDWFRRYN